MRSSLDECAREGSTVDVSDDVIHAQETIVPDIDVESLLSPSVPGILADLAIDFVDLLRPTKFMSGSSTAWLAL